MSPSNSPRSSLDEPKSKRRRMGPTRCDGCSDDPRSPSHHARVEKHPFWFNDGDVIFQVEDARFKIHRDKLQCSLVLWDMFELPQPPDAENIDGCPLVAMAGDSMKDWMAVLKWMYDPQGFSAQVAVFDVIAGVLRIASKYEMPALRQAAISELELHWPVDLANMNFNAFSNAPEAIQLARECDVPSILPAAFYALSVQRWSCSADGGRSHTILSPHDLRRLIVGRERLQDIYLQLTLDPLSTPSHPLICLQCKPLLESHWRQKLRPDYTSPRSCWLLKVLKDMLASDDGASHTQLCPPCVETHRSMIGQRLAWLLHEIPQVFAL